MSKLNEFVGSFSDVAAVEAFIAARGWTKAVGWCFTETSTDSLRVWDGVVWVLQIRDNLDAVVDPTVFDDSSLGYQKGSRWLNSAKRTVYTCFDTTVGAAVWAAAMSATIGAVYPTVHGLLDSVVITTVAVEPYNGGVIL